MAIKMRESQGEAKLYRVVKMWAVILRSDGMGPSFREQKKNRMLMKIRLVLELP